MIIPKLPKVGDRVFLFGIRAVVTVVEPQSDYVWHIELVSESGSGAMEHWVVNVPTDFRTI
jgi:hypothetical protein